MFKKTTQTVLALSLALGAFGTTAIALANTDQVVHPASACRWESELVEGATSFTSSQGIVHSDTTNPFHTLVCGVDRFNLTNTDGLRDLDVRVNNRNIDPKDVSCEIMSLRPDGSIVKSVGLTQTVPMGPFRLDWNGALNQGVSYGAYAVQCSLPANVVLNNILQREF